MSNDLLYSTVPQSQDIQCHMLYSVCLSRLAGRRAVTPTTPEQQSSRRSGSAIRISTCCGRLRPTSSLLSLAFLYIVFRISLELLFTFLTFFFFFFFHLKSFSPGFPLWLLRCSLPPSPNLPGLLSFDFFNALRFSTLSRSVSTQRLSDIAFYDRLEESV